MILPLGHDGMTLRRMPWMTFLIVLVNFVAFVSTAHDPDNFRLWGFIPATPTPWAYVTSMFIHAGWLHLLGNMYFLYLCGCTVEDLWGRPLYVATYVSGGLAALALHCHFFPDRHAALVGASGAISAIMGAFFIRCFETELRCLWLDFPIVLKFKVRAGWVLFFWFAHQVLLALLLSELVGIAFWAHVGGFAYGALVAVLLAVSGVERSVIAPAIESKLNLVQLHPRLAKALACMEERDYRNATGHLRAVLRDRPDDSDSCHLLAECYSFLGDVDSARSWLRRELQIHLRARNGPRIVDAYFVLRRSSGAVVLNARETHVVVTALRREGYHRHANELAPA